MHEETGYHHSETLLLWLSLTVFAIERCKRLLDNDDQVSQVVQREFQEVTVRMDRAESLSLDDPPGLVLRKTTALPDCPCNQSFSPRIDCICILRTSPLQHDHSWLSCVSPRSGHDPIAAVDERSHRVILIRFEEDVRGMVGYHDEELFGG